MAIEQARQTAEALRRSFLLPDVAESMRLLHEHHSEFGESLRRFADESKFAETLAALRSPWLDAAREVQSLRGFTALQSMGHVLRDIPAFGDPVEEPLRQELGDWRDTITFDESALQGISSRTDFYIARGLNTELTDFPADAFSESLKVAGLTTEKPVLVVAYGPPVPPAADPEEEKGFARTNDAHDWLMRMESWLRRFIDERMTTAFGPDWPKHRLPNGVYDEWMDKKRAAAASGESERPLVAYADFRDYESVICKRDNWPVFAKAFERRESVRESLQRLCPVRICTMHARAITQDDELYLYVEVRRLMNAMRRS